jgi:hypothetical protein
LNKKGIGDVDEDAAVDDEGMMPCPLMIHVVAWIMSFPKFPLHISLRGGISVFATAVNVRSVIRLR